mgnify:CR=1 FL=1
MEPRDELLSVYKKLDIVSAYLKVIQDENEILRGDYDKHDLILNNDRLSHMIEDLICEDLTDSQFELLRLKAKGMIGK